MVHPKFQACIFHPPRNTDSLSSKDGYENRYFMNVIVFESSTSRAMTQATTLADTIRRRKRTIPLRNPDGSITSQMIEFSDTEVSKLEEGVAQIALEFTDKQTFV